MRVSMFFAALLAVAIVATGCDKPDEYKIDNSNPKIKLLSESVMEFAAEGGEGVISYEYVSADDDTTRFSLVPIKATVECSAAWVENISSNEDFSVTFDVAPNEGGARETTVVLSYGEYSVDVAIHQAGREE